MLFLETYLDSFYYNQLIGNYEASYLENMDMQNIIDICLLLENHKFYFIPDIIVGFIEIFELKKRVVEEKLLYLKEKLGENYVHIIANDLRHLQCILD